jgi:hypothetical protein
MERSAKKRAIGIWHGKYDGIMRADQAEEGGGGGEEDDSDCWPEIKSLNHRRP